MLRSMLVRLRLVIALAVGAAVMHSTAAAEPRVLRVGMDTRQPPWSFVPGVDLTNEDFRKNPTVTAAQMTRLTGFDVDVVKALGKRLSATMKIVPTAWFDIEAGLVAGNYDMIVSSWSPNPRMPDSIVASIPYHEWGLLIATLSSNTALQSYQDLDGVKVGHYRDPAVERSLFAMAHGNFVTRDAPEILFDELKAGKLGAVIFDSLYVRWRVANDPTLRVVGEPLNRLGYHVALRKVDTGLVQEVQNAVRGLLASDEMVAIRNGWEGATPK
jgi:ABC-type amino acid transport substrate-binding protein